MERFDPHHLDGTDGCGISREGTWAPEDFGLFLQRSCRFEKEVQAPWSHRLDYNEILIDATHWTNHLPDAIEAFVGESDLARQQHQRFLQQYGLTPDEVPLLKINPIDWDKPFLDAKR